MPANDGAKENSRVSPAPSEGQADSSGWVVAYHEILPEESQYSYHVTCGQFEKHLGLFASLAKGGSSRSANPMVTFDDGHRTNYENAFPLLERAGLKATFFALAGSVASNPDFISWSQAREMVSAGHRLQSHGWSHRLLTLCSPEELHDELARSKQELEQRLGMEVTSVSAPGGRWDARVISGCARAGYKTFFHSNPWMPPKSQDGVQIRGRLMITGKMDSAALRAQMEMGGARRLYCRTKYGAKEKARTILGDRLYHRLWCRLSNYSPEDGMEIQMEGQARRRSE